MYCVGCIMFGIANKNKYLGQQSKLENIKVCYWAMSKICKGGGRTCFHILDDICCVGEAWMVFAQQQNIYLS